MRAGLAFIAALALCVTPVVAQGKTKAGVVPQAVRSLEICELFADGDVLALEAAISEGWDAYEDESESPYVKTYSAGREIPGLGYGDLFVLVESYPHATFGYCRIDVSDLTGDGEQAVQSILELPRYDGQSIVNSTGTFASLQGAEDSDRMLLTHVDEYGFAIQLSNMTLKSGEDSTP